MCCHIISIDTVMHDSVRVRSLQGALWRAPRLCTRAALCGAPAQLSNYIKHCKRLGECSLLRFCVCEVAAGLIIQKMPTPSRRDERNPRSLNWAACPLPPVTAPPTVTTPRPNTQCFPINANPGRCRLQLDGDAHRAATNLRARRARQSARQGLNTTHTHSYNHKHHADSMRGCYTDTATSNIQPLPT
jgi:hypothetical protein